MRVVEIKKFNALYESISEVLDGLNGLVREMVDDNYWYPPHIMEELVLLHGQVDDVVDEHFLVKETE